MRWALLASVTLLWLTPEMAATAQSTVLELVGSLDGAANLVATDGRYAYVAGDEALRVIDISDPANPAERGTLSLPDQIYSLHLVGTHAFLALGLQGLHIVDLSDPTSPQTIGMHETGGQTLGVTTNGSAALVVNLMTGLEIVDVSDRTSPALVTTADTDGYQWGVGSDGSNVFIVDQPTGIHLFDVTTPEMPELLGMYPTPRPATSVTAAGRTAYAVYGWTGQVEILDFSDPSNPRAIGTYRPGGRTQRVVVDGSQLYAPAGPAGIEIVDVSEPETPAPVATYDTAGNALDIAVHDDLVLVADGTGLVVLRVR